MDVYEKLYLRLFNAITDALAAMDSGCRDLAKEVLINAQQNAEEIYTSCGE